MLDDNGSRVVTIQEKRDTTPPTWPSEDVPMQMHMDYYRQRYERNRGLRIDFVLGSPSLTQRVTHAFIDREERARQGASDHAPVIVDLGPAAG